jgi:hypothetical protein
MGMRNWLFWPGLWLLFKVPAEPEQEPEPEPEPERPILLVTILARGFSIGRSAVLKL